MTKYPSLSNRHDDEYFNVRIRFHNDAKHVKIVADNLSSRNLSNLFVRLSPSTARKLLDTALSSWHHDSKRSQSMNESIDSFHSALENTHDYFWSIEDHGSSLSSRCTSGIEFLPLRIELFKLCQDVAIGSVLPRKGKFI
jgi:hypothetical protein